MKNELAQVTQNAITVQTQSERVAMVGELLCSGMNEREVFEWCNATSTDDPAGRPWGLTKREATTLIVEAKRRLSDIILDLRNAPLQIGLIASGFLSDRASLIAQGDFKGADVVLSRYAAFVGKLQGAAQTGGEEPNDVEDNDDD